MTPSPRPPAYDPERASLRFDRKEELILTRKILSRRLPERLIDIDAYYIIFMLEETEVALTAPTLYSIYNATHKKP